MAELVKYSGTFDDSFPTNEAIEAVDAMRDLAHDDAHFEQLATLET
jgi:hypothetical protein